MVQNFRNVQFAVVELYFLGFFLNSVVYEIRYESLFFTTLSGKAILPTGKRLGRDTAIKFMKRQSVHLL